MDPAAEQTLKHLGIDRWVLRPAPRAVADAGAPAQGPSTPPATAATRSVVPPELKAALAESAGSQRPARGAEAGKRQAPGRVSNAVGDSGSPDASAATAASPSDLPACKVLALGASGALVLSFAPRPALSQRVARDLLLSIARTAAEPGQFERIFDWDPSALAAAQVSGRRALTAFAQRQLDDAGASSVLLTSELQEAVPELARALEAAGARCLAVPALEQLANDAEAKRQLWATLQTLKG